MKTISGVNIFAVSIFVPILVIGIFGIAGTNGVFVSPATHALVVLATAVLGILSALSSMCGFKCGGSLRLLLISGGLLTSSVFLLIYGFFSSGILFLNQQAALSIHAEWFLATAMLLAGIFLFLTIGLVERTIKIPRRIFLITMMFLLVCAIVVGAWFIVSLAAQMKIGVSANIVNWTPLGRFLQIGSIMLLVVSAIRYLHGAFIIRSETALAFATGTVLFVMSNLTFSLVRQDFGPFFWAAHLWLFMGFASFFWGAHITQKTHEHGSRVAKI